MQPTPDFRRLATAVALHEPDRVPLVEAVVDPAIMSQFLGRTVTPDDLAGQVEFWSQAGYDYVPLTVGMMQPGRVTEQSRISQVIRDVVQPQATGGDGWNLERHAYIGTEQDLEQFPWNEAARLDLSSFERIQSLLPPGMKIIALSGKILTLTWMLMGFENFAINLRLNPGFVRRVVQKVAEIQLTGLRTVARMDNVAAAWAVDDLAFGTGPMVSLTDLRKHIFPYYEEFGHLCRQHRLLFFFHTDGLVWDLIEDLIAVGVQALHPFDPSCMDIVAAKERYGRRLCLVGNVSNELLMNGTRDQVREATLACLRSLAPGGGYCLGSGNSVPAWAKIADYREMLDTHRRWGSYPICIP